MRSTIFFLFFFLVTGYIFFYSTTALASPQSGSISNSFKLRKDNLPPNDSLKVFEKTDIPSAIDAVVWTKYLQNGLMKIVGDAVSSGIKSGTYTIDVRFIIERNGSISNVLILKSPLRGQKKAVEDIKNEVEDLIRNGPMWTPAKVNEEEVRSYHTQPITFMIGG